MSLKDLYYYVAVLKKMDPVLLRVRKDEIYHMILAREIPGGGFGKTPGSRPAYLEETHFAIEALNLMGEKPGNISENAVYISGLQNPNGGFRRSPYGGISSPENTWRAVECLKILEGML